MEWETFFCAGEILRHLNEVRRKSNSLKLMTSHVRKFSNLEPLHAPRDVKKDASRISLRRGFFLLSLSKGIYSFYKTVMKLTT